MAGANNVNAIPQAAPGQLNALENSALPVAKSLEIPRLLNSATPPSPLPAPPTLYDHGLGTRVDSKH